MATTHDFHKCPDCGGLLADIKLFARGWVKPVSKTAADAAVEYYAAKEAPRSPMAAMFDEAGTVESTMCGDCRRIFIHGRPK